MQKLLLPLSIVLAGVLIGGAIIYTNQGGLALPADNGVPVFGEVRGVQDSDHVRGSRDAEVIIFEYSDTECPYCQIYHESLKQVTAAYENVAWVYRHFPIPQLHPKAAKEGEALECAAAQGGNDMFWQYADLLYTETPANNGLDIGVYNAPSPTPTDANGTPYYTEATPRSDTDAGKLSDFAETLGLDVAQFEECLANGTFADRVNEDYIEATSAGANGTPTSIARSKDKLSRDALNALKPLETQYDFVVLDDYTVLIPGAMPFDIMQDLIDAMTK